MTWAVVFRFTYSVDFLGPLPAEESSQWARCWSWWQCPGVSVPRCLVCSDLVLPVCTGRGGAAQHLGPAAPQPQTWLRCPGNSGEEEKQVGPRLQSISQDFRDCPRGHCNTYKWVITELSFIMWSSKSALCWPDPSCFLIGIEQTHLEEWDDTVLCCVALSRAVRKINSLQPVCCWRDTVC